MPTSEHRKLLDVILKLSGMVVISTYPSSMYSEALKGWQRVEKGGLAGSQRGSVDRVEVLWINPAAVAAREAALRV